MKHPAASIDREADIDALLVNWANYVRGGLPGFVLGDLPDDAPAVCDVTAAELLEQVMARCRRERDDLWRLARVHYLKRMTYRDGARYMRLSVTTYKDRRGKLLAWVDGALVG